MNATLSGQLIDSAAKTKCRTKCETKLGNSYRFNDLAYLTHLTFSELVLGASLELGAWSLELSQ